MYDPKTRLVKLLDFGIATDTQASNDERLTRAGFFVGTLMYIAPEALSGEIVTAAADQYSLATIAYFLLTRCLPYTAKAPREMFTQLLTMPPIPLKEAGEEGLDFSPELDAVVMRALSRAPSARFRSHGAISIPAFQRTQRRDIRQLASARNCLSALQIYHTTGR